MKRIIFWTLFFAAIGAFLSGKQAVIDIFEITKGTLIGATIGFVIGVCFSKFSKTKFVEEKEEDDQ
jgi:hypothetical protein